MGAKRDGGREDAEGDGDERSLAGGGSRTRGAVLAARLDAYYLHSTMINVTKRHKGVHGPISKHGRPKA